VDNKRVVKLKRVRMCGGLAFQDERQKCATLDCALQDKQGFHRAGGNLQRLFVVDAMPRDFIYRARLAHHETQIRARPIEKLAPSLGRARKKSMFAASAKYLSVRILNNETKAMALDERDGALVSRVRGKRSACLEARKAEAPGESLCLCRCATASKCNAHGGNAEHARGYR
jgi:hypothetical protein